MNGAAELRRARARAAAEFRPSHVDTLLVSEAPPSAPDRYFYFLDISAHDSLFRHVVQATFGERPDRDKLPWLEALRDAGSYVIHLSLDPFRDRRVLRPLVPDLIRRCRHLAPQRIVVIGAPLYDLIYQPLLAAKLPVVDVRLPYPGSGQQRRFLDLATPLLAIDDDEAGEVTSRAPSR